MSIFPLKTTFGLHKARVCPNGFRTAFASVSVLIYKLREFPLSAAANRFELRCHLKHLLLLFIVYCMLYITNPSSLHAEAINDGILLPYANCVISLYP